MACRSGSGSMRRSKGVRTRAVLAGGRFALAQYCAVHCVGFGLTEAMVGSGSHCPSNPHVTTFGPTCGGPMIPLHLNSTTSPNFGGVAAVGSAELSRDVRLFSMISTFGPRFAPSMRRGHVSFLPNKSHSLVRPTSLLNRPTMHALHSVAEVAAVAVE